MKTKIIYLTVMAAMFSIASYAQDGATTFKQKCGVCHTVGKGKLVGPDLKGIHSKYKEDWLKKWVASSQALVKKNDPVAVKLFNENNKMVMPDQQLNDAEFASILGFVKDESEKGAVASQPTGEAKAESKSASQVLAAVPVEQAAPSGPEMSWKAATWVLGAFCGLLVIVVIALGTVISNMAKAVGEKHTPTAG